MFKAFLFHNDFSITRKPTRAKLDPLLQFPFSLKFCSTSISDPNSFAVSYFINSFGFSLESALKASKQVGFKTSKKPNSVLTFFKNQGFSDSDINNIIRREPWLLSCDAHKRVLPKFQFLLSKGASASDIVSMVGKNPRFMKLSLENRIISSYNLVNKFLQSDKRTLVAIIGCPSLLSRDAMALNVKLLVDNGVANINIFRILRVRPYIIYFSDLGKTVQELKNLGFDPSKSYFGDALLAKRTIGKSKWNEKIDSYKRWGWSEETILEAFRRQPYCMIASDDKINRVMRFWVSRLGWDSSYLVKGPGIFGYNLERRVMPRALVVHYLLSKGLRSKSASLLTPFFMSEEMFLRKYVKCYGKEETSQLLKLYQGKMNVEDKGTQEP